MSRTKFALRQNKELLWRDAEVKCANIYRVIRIPGSKIALSSKFDRFNTFS